MLQDLKSAVKDIVRIDIMIGTLTVAILFVFGKIYIPATLLGLSSAVFNFYLSGLIVSSIAVNPSKASVSRHILGYVCRIVLVVSLGLICFVQNKYNVFFFILGFVLHFVGLGLYGIKLQVSTKGGVN